MKRNPRFMCSHSPIARELPVFQRVLKNIGPMRYGLMSLVLAALALLFAAACSATLQGELAKEEKEWHREDVQDSAMEKANINDELNPTERKDVDKVIDGERKERARTEKAIFGH